MVDDKYAGGCVQLGSGRPMLALSKKKCGQNVFAGTHASFGNVGQNGSLLRLRVGISGISDIRRNEGGLGENKQSSSSAESAAGKYLLTSNISPNKSSLGSAISSPTSSS
jgi:hypothetical protein